MLTLIGDCQSWESLFGISFDKQHLFAVILRHSFLCIFSWDYLSFISLAEVPLIAFVLLAQQSKEVNIAVHWGMRKSLHKFSISLIACFHFGPAAGALHRAICRSWKKLPDSNCRPIPSLICHSLLAKYGCNSSFYFTFSLNSPGLAIIKPDILFSF